MADFWLKAGDLVPSIKSVLRDANGTPIDIRDAAITFVMRAFDAAVPTIENPAENLQVDNDDSTNGTVRYDWLAGDTDVPGGYHAEWRVQFADGVGTVPNHDYKMIAILPALGGGS